MDEIQIISFNKELGKYLAQGDFIMRINWTAEKPTFKENCILLTAVQIHGKWEYDSYLIELLEDGIGLFYWGLLDMDGNEIDDINELTAERYFIIPQMKTVKQ